MSMLQQTFRYTYIWPIVCILILGFSLLSCEDAVASSSSSSNTSSGPPPIEISDQAGLESMADDLSKNYILQNDITITTDSWTALGTSSSEAFSGRLDGNGKTISIEAKTTGGNVSWGGLFYQLSSATEGAVVVKNLDFKIVSELVFNSSNTGVLAKNLTQGVVENIALYGSGGASDPATIDANVAAVIENLGGLIGQISTSNKVELNNISANINMTRNSANQAINVGGLVGKVDNSNALLDIITVKGTLTLPKTTATGTDLSDNIGGIVGYIKGTLSQAVSIVDVSGNTKVGAMAGEADNSSLSNVYASGQVRGNTKVGGLVGYVNSASINFALALGKVTGNADVGGLVGGGVSSTADNAFYDSTTTGKTSSTLGTAKTTAELQTATTFDKFDKISFWNIKDGSYPILYVFDATTSNPNPVTACIPDSNTIDISNQKELEGIADNLCSNYILQNDITITTDSWTALGTSSSEAFTGQLDGNGKVISIEAETAGGKVTWDGLFYQLSSATEGAVVVKNLDLKTESDLKFISSNTGVLAKNLTQGVVKNIRLYGSGGVSSEANIDLNIADSAENLGGLIGLITWTVIPVTKVELNNISANINMTKTSTTRVENVGGIVGHIFRDQAQLHSIIVKGSLSIPTSNTIYTYAIGGIVGYMKGGSISNAVSSASVSGLEAIGGLVGRADYGILSNVYASGAVNGNSYVGGLVGYTIFSDIRFALALGSVTGTTLVGGLVGVDFLDDGSYSNDCFYGSTETTQTNSAMGTAKSTADLQKASTFENFDNTSFWVIKDNSFPKLYLEESTVLYLIRTNHAEIMDNVIELEFSEPVSVTNTSFTLNGTAIPTSNVTTTDNTNLSISISPSDTIENTFDLSISSRADASNTFAGSLNFLYYSKADRNVEYYDIKSCAGLQGIRFALDSKFELVQDIDCDDSKNWNKHNNVAAGFIPIGDYYFHFTGSLLGNGYKISKLYINRPSAEYVGLFGYNLGQIESLGIIDANITGKTSVGILVGLNGGTIRKVYTSGSVTASGDDIGGVVGFNYSYSTSTISLSYSTAKVEGKSNVGGLVGSNAARISESYAAGTVTGTGSNLGGLIGRNLLNIINTVARSYYDMVVSTQSDTGKGVGKSTADMQKAATYVGWDTSVWNLVDGAYPTFK